MINVTTDCSGIDGVILALKDLQIPFKYVSASDVDPMARQVIALHQPDQILSDIADQDFKPCDLYVCGFPCQPFSLAGTRDGFQDIRGTVFYHVADFIRKSRPGIFILENVFGLTSDPDFQKIIHILGERGSMNGQPPSMFDSMFFDDSLNYHIHFRILNTQHFGIPQHRKRIFIVGFKDPRRFDWPSRIRLNKTVYDFAEESVPDKYLLSDSQIHSLITKKNLQPSGMTARNKNIARTIQAPANSVGNYKGMNFFYLDKDRKIQDHPRDWKFIRRLTPKECFRLQGFSDEYFDTVSSLKFSDRRLYRFAANAFSFNVIKLILKQIYQ